MPHPLDVVAGDDCTEEKSCLRISGDGWSEVSLDGADRVDESVLVEVSEETSDVFASGECLEEELFEGNVLVLLGTVVLDEYWLTLDLLSED